MASRKLARDFFIAKQPLFRQLLAPASASQRVLSGAIRLRWTEESSFVGRREFSVFNEFSNKFKGEASRNQDFQKSVKELKEKTEELKGVKEGLKARTKQTTEQLYKQVDGVWTEAEATARKVYSNVGEKISAAKAEVKESFGFGKQETPGSTGASKNFHSNAENGGKSTFGEENQQQQHQQSGPGENSESLFGKVKSGVSSKASMAFQKVKEAKPIDMVKKGYDLVKDELKGNVAKRKHLEHTAPTGEPSTKVEKSSRTDIAVLPSKQSKWGKKWDAFMEKMRGHPLYKRARGISEPVVTKSQEIAEDVRERWETSDHPVVHKIQDLNDTVFGETATAMSFKEIRQRDPSFSLPEFVSEVQEVIKPVLNAYFKCDVEILKKYCSSEVIERCKAEHKAFESQDIFFDNKILHISEVEVQSTKMMGESPIIVVAFQTQQVYCVRDRHGAVKEGGKDTIHTVYYAWAMQQVDPEELGEGALYPIWRIREMQQFGVQALI